MKKLLFLPILYILIFSTLQAQNKNSCNSFSRISSENKVLLNNIKEQYSKSVIWNWDTIITYDENNNLNKRITQTFYNNFKYAILTERWKNNEWKKLTLDTFLYDSNGDLISELILNRIDDSLWVNNMVYKYTYNSGGKLNTELKQRWENNVWINSFLYSFTYNSSGKVTNISYYGWGDSLWYKETEDLYSYDTNDSLQNYIRQSWCKDSLVGKFLIDYTYNLGKLTSELKKNWDNNNWVNDYLFTYTYDIHGNKNTEVLQNWVNNTWENTYKHISTYNNNHKVLTSLYQNWESNTWVNSSIDSSIYNTSGNLIALIQQQWQNNSWINIWKYNFTYDTFGNEEIMLVQQWQNNSWIDYAKRKYSSDIYGNSLSGKYEEWNMNWFLFIVDLPIYTSAKEFLYAVTASRFEAHFKSFSTGIIENKNHLEIYIYPNPANDFITIAYNKNNIKTLSIFNLQGQEVLSKVVNQNENTISINVSDLFNGIYFLQLQIDKGFVNKKFVINR